MPSSRFMLIVIIALLVPQSYAGTSASQTIQGITVTAQIMSCRDGEVTFGQDVRTSRIYPIRLSLRNEKSLPVSVSMESIHVSLADVLTVKSLTSSISASSMVARVATVVLFPFGLFAVWHQNKLAEFLSIVEKFSMDQTVIIQPGDSYQTYVFPQLPRPPVEHLKDEQGNRLRDAHGKELPTKRPAFVAPEALEVTINFVVDKSPCRFAVSFSLPV